MHTLAVNPQPGEVVGDRYRIDAAIGGGGYGAVYRATQLNMGRAVALKLLHPGLFTTEGAHERFCREAELAQQLKHPNTVRVYDFGRTATGLPFIVWEYLEGQPLDLLIAREGPQAPARVVRIASQVLKALMEAHALGIVHRDIKPSNLFVSNFSGEPDFVKVLDFGIAKTVSENGPAITSGTMPVGTPSYMAPEQVRNENVGPATDLYALGLVMAELLSGRPVVQGRSLVDVFMAQASAEPVSLPPEVLQGPLGNVIQRATAKASGARYHSAGEMLADLEQAPATHVSPAAVQYAATLRAAPQPTPPTPPNTVTPHMVTALPAPKSSRASSFVWLALGGGALFLLLGLGGVGALMMWLGADRAATRPATEAPAAIELDGIGAETIGKRIASRGWKLAADPVLNLEGTHQMHIVAIQRGGQHGVATIYDFVDIAEAERHAGELRKSGLAVALDRDLILSVEVRGDPTEARALVDLITRP